MIRYLPAMDYVIPAVVGHHERYDGTGYPRGLAGQNIPYMARILTIADCFDAMTAKRPYKQALSVEYAVNELEKNGQSRMLSMLNMVSNFAGLPLYFSFVVILGNTGIFVLALRAIGIQLSTVFRLYSIQGLLLMFIYFQLPLGSLMLVPAFQAVDSSWKEAAEILEASPFQFWTRIGIPVMLPSLLDTFALLFANAITAYATVLLLVTTSIPLLPVKITTMFTGEMTPQKEMGSALAIWMIIIMLAVICICNLLKKLTYKGGEQV